ncbi:Protein NOI4 [Linum perenne]
MAKAAAGGGGSGGNNNKEGVPLPKFGEWDMNNGSAAQGYTVIFDKARNDKKNKVPPIDSQLPIDHNNDSPTFNKNEPYRPPESSRKMKWLCCG